MPLVDLDLPALNRLTARRSGALPSPDVPRATVKCFTDAKGYGFLTRTDGQEVFAHYSSIAGDGFRTLTEGQTVDYDEQQGPRGLFALRVTVVLTDATEQVT